MTALIAAERKGHMQLVHTLQLHAKVPLAHPLSQPLFCWHGKMVFNTYILYTYIYIYIQKNIYVYIYIYIYIYL